MVSEVGVVAAIGDAGAAVWMVDVGERVAEGAGILGFVVVGAVVGAAGRWAGWEVAAGAATAVGVEVVVAVGAATTVLGWCFVTGCTCCGATALIGDASAMVAVTEATPAPTATPAVSSRTRRRTTSRLAVSAGGRDISGTSRWGGMGERVCRFPVKIDLPTWGSGPIRSDHLVLRVFCGPRVRVPAAHPVVKPGGENLTGPVPGRDLGRWEGFSSTSRSGRQDP